MEFYTRTTFKIETQLKKEAEKRAIEQNKNLQDIFNDALRLFLDKQAKIKAMKLVPIRRQIGIRPEDTKRENIYKED